MTVCPPAWFSRVSVGFLKRVVENEDCYVLFFSMQELITCRAKVPFIMGPCRLDRDLAPIPSTEVKDSTPPPQSVAQDEGDLLPMFLTLTEET